MPIIWLLIIGSMIGWLVHQLANQNGKSSYSLSLILGMMGAALGFFIYNKVLVANTSNPYEIVVSSIVGAFILVLAGNYLYAGNSKSKDFLE